MKYLELLKATFTEDGTHSEKSVFNILSSCEDETGEVYIRYQYREDVVAKINTKVIGLPEIIRKDDGVRILSYWHTIEKDPEKEKGKEKK